MSNINLLPWREARAQRQKKQFGALLGIFVLATVALGFFANWLVDRQIVAQQQRNQRLVQEMTILDAQLGEIRLLKERRKELIDRMQLIEQLQMRRNVPVRLFNQLPSLVPNGVYLNTLSMQNNIIDVNGKTEAYGRVASMMRRIDGSGWLGQSKISTIFAADVAPVSLSQFSMMFLIANNAAAAGNVAKEQQ
ncbi:MULTISPECIES: PilN family type IV pilus biogenesis protein TapN [Aeromonas]|jgi:type IV pilus assembly protein PilN|uniref:PilN family type IV pilus biogenesis protein TapN n=1 Tax=Aeromonas TaxID=642 RepID=UPI001116AA63|nr:PilN family type IV pilus biogenesis protein TapN [Aeromonas veronii]MBL0505507.1 PilN family type IV pilus biogenesis protein TapN [Aeromonas veronii]MBL0613297.1 PilN family type IV pilus biogenesis protein TapN [Aeromonas veronii]MBL0622014.1 PilN family type IV pilus biogenesis protein TapN [Aeromonas veronii]QSR46735.1 PilN family type IV pilus biogenesis protein TapN [Aeromonas veronii]HDX8350837.1 PilN family type IV pilus biogenesis protein TapN [Aeromonas veronii]